jgi:hypothetical protein
MIPIWKERGIRNEITENPEVSGRSLSRKFKVSRWVVTKIRSLPGLRPRKTPKPRKRLVIKKRCPECGGILNIWPCPLCRPWAYHYDDVKTETEMEKSDAAKKAA